MMTPSGSTVASRRPPLDRIWIVVADGGTARMFRVADDRRTLTTVRELTSADLHHKSRDLVSDRPGRGFESANPARHAIEPRTDPHDQAKAQFIAEVAGVLNHENQAGSYDEIILVVARSQAASFKEALDKPTRARVRNVVTKDLTNTPAQEVWDRLIEENLLPPRAGAPG